jgi:hypothetical protein
MVIKWKPDMKPDQYRKYEVNTLRKHKNVIVSGLGITYINKEEKKPVFPITLYNSFNTYEPNKIIAFCQFIILNKDDANIINKNTIIILNEKCVVIVGYLNEYMTRSPFINKWSVVNSIRNAYKFFNDEHILIGFHGTDKNTAKIIKKDGFRDFNNLKLLNIPANYFTPYIWYAYNWAYSGNTPGTILVCLISLKKPMPQRSFDAINKIDNLDERAKFTLEKVADKKYDGIHLEDEIWVWDTTSVIIVGEIYF